MLSTFGPRTRRDAQKALLGFGDAFAGRGADINETIRQLRPFLVHLTPVMRNLSSPRSELRNLIPALGAAAAEVAPVAEVQAQLFADLADTFAALNRDPAALQETIEETPPTLEAATASFRVQTPFLARFADVSRRLQPGVAELPTALPLINGALAAGVPAFEQTPELSDDLQDLFEALESLSEAPNTLLALKDLRRAAQVSKPALVHVAPYQTVCNYLVYFFNPLGTHLSETVPGRHRRSASRRSSSDLAQANTLGATESKRPVDVPSDEDPQTRARCRRCTRSPTARRSTRRGGRTASPGRPATPTGSSPTHAGPPRPPDPTSRAAAATSSSTATRPASQAAPTSRASSASKHLKDVP